MLDMPPVAPLAFVRRPHQHRYQAWAPKLCRCIVLTSWPAMQYWVMLESQPHVRKYCERPATAIIDGKERVIDFWTQLDNQEQWIIVGNEDDSILPVELEQPSTRSIERTHIQFVSPQSVEPRAVWIENWLTILPYMASAAQLVEPPLVAQVIDACHTATPLHHIEKRLDRHDRILVRTAVFMALHHGTLVGLDLEDRPWDLDSRFIKSNTGRQRAP